MISVHFEGKPFNIRVIQVYTPTTDAEEAEVDYFYKDLQDLREQQKKEVPFNLGGLKCKTRKSRDIWSNRQILSWSYEMKQGKG